MSETKTSQVALLQTKLEQLDRFAAENSLTTLTEGKGAFTSALSVASAIGELKVMLTEDVMRPILALQGTALGFKTDKDKEGGYQIETVRDCFIEGTLKGFKFVGNQSNIIGGRFYPTKEGFEDWFARKGRDGFVTDVEYTITTPKMMTETEAQVVVSMKWKRNGTPEEIKPHPISIRVNKGQGADAIVGKAKRKVMAEAYSKITNTTITDGSVEDAEAINVDARPVADGATAEKAGVMSDDTKQLLTEAIGKHQAKANEYLRKVGTIKPDQTFLDLKPKSAASIIARPKEFLQAIGAE